MKKLFLLAMLLWPALGGSQSASRSMLAAYFTILVDGDVPRPPFALSITPSRGGSPRTVKYDSTNSPSYSLNFGKFHFQRMDPRLSVYLPEGQYRVEVTGLPVNYRVKSMTAGTVDLLRFPFTLSPETFAVNAITLGASEPGGGKKVSGRVTGLLPAHLADRPRVTLAGAGGFLSARVDAEGHFEFAHVPPGNYTARLAETIIVQPSPQARLKVADKDVSDVRIALSPVREVIGRAFVEGSGPTPALVFTVGGDFGSVTNPIGSTNGIFKLILPEGPGRIELKTDSLPAGYTLRSLLYGSVDLIKNSRVRIAAADTTELRVVFAVTTVGITLKLPDGSPLSARPPEPNAWVNVRGSVTGIEPGSQPLILHLGGRNPGQVWYNFQLKQDGAFQFGRIAQGQYALTGSMNGPDISFHFRSIDVGDKDISDIKVAVPRTKTVYGRLVVEGEGPMPIINYTFGLDADGPAPIAVSVTPECNGSFAVRLPEGDHRVSGSLPAGFLRAFTYGSTNLLRERLRVSAEDSMELRITLAANSTVGRSGATLGGGVGPLFFGLGSRQRIPPCPS